MSETIQDLYTSFSEQMEPIQEDSRYFRYLFEMAQASGTTIEQQREELVKVVDEEWISMIEDSLDAINTIIEKPRRFITTEEEVVPVSLAKDQRRQRPSPEPEHAVPGAERRWRRPSHAHLQRQYRRDLRPVRESLYLPPDSAPADVCGQAHRRDLLVYGQRDPQPL